MGSSIDLDIWSDHDMVTDMHHVIIDDITQRIQKDVIPDKRVLSIVAVEGRFDMRILADFS